MHDLPVFIILAWDRLNVPANIFGSCEHVHACRLHARPYLIHMPTLPAHAFVHHSWCFLSNTMLVLAIYARITTKPECLVKPIIECSFFKQVHGSVHPDDQVPEPVMEVIRYIVWPKRPPTGHP